MVDQSRLWDAHAAAEYDTPGEGMFAPEVLGPTVELLSSLADGGRALELAIGTGRVAIPLREAGIEVTGIELSEAMVARLREKVDAQQVPVVHGDMTTTTAGRGSPSSTSCSTRSGTCSPRSSRSSASATPRGISRREAAS